MALDMLTGNVGALDSQAAYGPDGRSAPIPLLEARGIVKYYGHVCALRGANFSVYPGEVVALLGDNGAGKSTLVKAISGVIHPDEGQLFFEGNQVRISSPIDARDLGIETVYQDLALAPDLDAATNIFMGREILRPGILGKLGMLDKKAMSRRTDEAFRTLKVGLKDGGAPVMHLSGGQRQGVAVARAVTWARKLVILDEPTAALGVVQSGRVSNLIQSIRLAGLAVVLITHNLPFVFQVADRMEVMRFGARVARFQTDGASMEDVVAAMTGALVQEDTP
jgi:simple sugar transport system ATP-binding protein